jgi:dienelactone hydrolase
MDQELRKDIHSWKWLFLTNAYHSSERETMKHFNFLILLVLITSTASTIKPKVSVNDKAQSGNSAPKPVNTVANGPEQEFFILQTEHPANRLDGCTVSVGPINSILFGFKRPGRSILILKAKYPLIITEQSGLTARLRPGWDGTLGYSLYALDVESGSAGSGRVRLEIKPTPTEGGQTSAEFNTRNSRFPDKHANFLMWQQDWRNKLISRLMNGVLPARVPLEAKVLTTEDHPLFSLQKIRYKSLPDRSNTLLLSLPKNVSSQVPLLIALHGHEAKWGEADSGAFTSGHADDFCAYFAERGWAVVQPATMDHILQHAGWTLQGEWTWDAIVALDYAAALPEVDKQSIAVIGLSTGGHLAMNLLAMDDRVRSGVVGCILSTWNHYRERILFPPGCDCGILSQLGDWLEQCDWAALAAPKPVQFQHGRKDAMFCPGADPALIQPKWSTAVMPKEEFESAFSEVKRAYQLAGEPKHVKLYIHNDIHRVDNEAAYLFLNSEIMK